MSRVDVRKFPPALTKGFAWVAGLVTAIAVCVHLATYGPNQNGPFLMNVATGLFPVIFLIFGPAVIVLAFARIPVDRLFAGFPVYVYIVGAAVTLYLFANFFLMLRALPLGNPEQDGATFYLNNHGSHIPVSADAYGTAAIHLARLISGHELFFFIYSALIAYQINGVRSGRISLEVAPRDDALERSPLPYPLSQMVRLQSALTPEACAERLLTFRPRTPWSISGTSQGLRGDASAAEFRLEIASAQSQMVYALGRFEGLGSPTSIRVLLTFKRWALISLVASALLIPIAWAVLGAAGFQLPGSAVAFVVVVGVVANVLIGLYQRRRLLVLIKQAMDAQEVPAT